MKIDLGNYKYCERDELEEIGKIKNQTASWWRTTLKINGTLFKTDKDNYVFYGRIYDKLKVEDICRGWKLLDNLDHRFFLSLCDTVMNSENKWEILGYEKV